MRKPLLALALFTLPFSAPSLAEPLPSLEAGWAILYQAEGDLNGDKRSDHAFILQRTEANEGIFSPRRLVVYLAEPNGYRLALQTQDSLLPNANDPDKGCLIDPLAEGSFKIEKGSLYFELYYFYSCGSWWTNRATYQLRYKNDIFELIGKEDHALHRATLMEEHSSVNYLTNRKKIITGINQNIPEEHRPKTEWKALDKEVQPATLDISKLKELP